LHAGHLSSRLVGALRNEKIIIPVRVENQQKDSSTQDLEKIAEPPRVERGVLLSHSRAKIESSRLSPSGRLSLA
jgi:hypothetical protein